MRRREFLRAAAGAGGVTAGGGAGLLLSACTGDGTGSAAGGL
jgi:hypothetical protein